MEMSDYLHICVDCCFNLCSLGVGKCIVVQVGDTHGASRSMVVKYKNKTTSALKWPLFLSDMRLFRCDDNLCWWNIKIGHNF